MRKSLVVAVALMMTFLLVTAGFGQAAARISGKVLDAETKKPIPDTKITATVIEGKTFKQETKSKKDGAWAFFFIDGSLKYKIVFEAPGYLTHTETPKLSIGGPNIKDILLVKEGSAAAAAVAATVPAGEIKIDPVVEAYNTGASLANEGKDAEALAKFEEAVAAKPDMTAAHIAIAKVALRLKQPDRAITAAKKVMEITGEDDPRMYGVLFDAYTAKGDKAAAAEAKKKMPANAPALFNDAAKAINANKDSEAEVLLKQAVEVDPSFAQAYYELGMIYVRAGKSAPAKENLEKYISLDPNGKDVSTAKEMLKYVK